MSSIDLPIAIPDDVGLIGGGLRFQALILDPGATGGLSMTPGLELWIG